MNVTSKRILTWIIELTDNEFAALYNRLDNKKPGPGDDDILNNLKTTMISTRATPV